MKEIEFVKPEDIEKEVKLDIEVAHVVKYVDSSNSKITCFWLK